MALMGFGSYEGTVIVGLRWGAPSEAKRVPLAKEGGWEAAYHAALGRDGVVADLGARKALAARTPPHRRGLRPAA